MFAPLSLLIPATWDSYIPSSDSFVGSSGGHYSKVPHQFRNYARF